jgi:tetratricopeptide (TPR) repeat protein
VALRRAALTLALGMFTDQQSIASLNQPEQALALLADAELQLAALDRAQADRLSGDLLGTLHGSRAISHARLGQLEAARHDAQQAIRYRERAVAQEPANVVARDGLVTEATNGGVILLRLGDAPGALAATRVAWAHVQTLARENGPGNKWLDNQPRVAQHHGRALLANGQFDEAVQVLPQAVALWQARVAELPANAAAEPAAAHPRRMLAWMRLQQAKALWGRGERGEGSAMAQRQVAELETLAQPPKAGDAMLNLGEACLFMAQAQPGARAAWLARARQAYERAGTLRPLNGDAALRCCGAAVPQAAGRLRPSVQARRRAVSRKAPMRDEAATVRQRQAYSRSFCRCSTCTWWPSPAISHLKSMISTKLRARCCGEMAVRMRRR